MFILWLSGVGEGVFKKLTILFKIFTNFNMPCECLIFQTFFPHYVLEISTTSLILRKSVLLWTFVFKTASLLTGSVHRLSISFCQSIFLLPQVSFTSVRKLSSIHHHTLILHKKNSLSLLFLRQYSSNYSSLLIQVLSKC